MLRFIRFAILAASACLLLSGQVWAHAHLNLAEPADKAVVSAPTAFNLTFSESLNPKFSGIKVTGPDRKEVALGESMLMDGGRVLMVAPVGKLLPGAYKVDWHALSVDGHKTNGSYGFTVAP
ncbi:copper homeostasis periplasmic binding protein CopC [Paludibacterium yongneupense]|uniref:copper homeostasis periplasmic binding protein CopC n=1 Tax=Paludibacterium yongneupense TaxID=400061 RepID=UPI0004094FA3|nr:copper homeostasis periplasmic binding protein CopC [Paludibacterium yongneupense]